MGRTRTSSLSKSSAGPFLCQRVLLPATGACALAGLDLCEGKGWAIPAGRGSTERSVGEGEAEVGRCILSSPSRRVRSLPLIASIPTIVVAAALQAAALWLSYQPIVRGR